MTTPVEHLSNLVVGVIESVSPDEFRILLELDAPQATALNTGTPSAFPRINGYVLIPNEAGATVAYISWIGIERSPYPKRAGLKDFGLVDLPFPLRKMSVSPVGTLTTKRDFATKTTTFELARGVTAFPSVGDQVLMPTPDQVEAIVGSRDSDRRVRIGTSPMAADARIMVDPDKLFGRHLAVLGNTGSGKSCTVAGLIRWSIEAAEKRMLERAASNPNTPPIPPAPTNMRFIVLDPNGEYSRAFQDLHGRIRVFRPGDDANPFVLPAWLWNSHEWSSITEAKSGAQRPLLMQALRNLRAGRALQEPLHVGIVRAVRLYRIRVAAFISDPTGTSYTDFMGMKNCIHLVKNMAEVLRSFLAQMLGTDAGVAEIEALAVAAEAFNTRHEVPNPRRGQPDLNAPNVAEWNAFLPLFQNVEDALPPVTLEEQISEDAPIQFDISKLADLVDSLSAGSSTNPNVANFVATLTLRIRSMLADQRLSPVINPNEQPTFEAWLSGLLGSAGGNGSVAIVDLSLVPSDVTHILIAVLARLIFESSQRYRKIHPEGKALPTVLVLEEAHTFVRKNVDDSGDGVSPAKLCREAFERIAREGRKFGLGVVLSSQRPSELSPTVLAQCNTFFLHRLVNDADQNLVARLVPDNVAGLLRELPSLPSRHAIMLGWATPIPVLVEVDELTFEKRPQSADPDFWDVWTRKEQREVNWQAVANDWANS